jgi:ATP-dependent exoDNAse (exonuclease V) alpha subunit
MISDELKYRILQDFGHEPTEEQSQALDEFCRFMVDKDSHSVMILRGSAGTGKTTLAGAVVRALTRLGQKLILMAPTGRAAKVFALYAGHEAFTIHRRIYRQKSAADFSSFSLNDNLFHDTLFIVDEASMISNGGESIFGSGCLLDDLMQYVYSGERCRLMLIGDKAQLPPVGEQQSAALTASALRGYGMTVFECDLNQVLRQSEDSGILWNATRIRGLGGRLKVEGGGNIALPQIRFEGFNDIQVMMGNDLVESLASSYSRVGMDETIVVTRSNKRANIYNQGIRNTVLDREEELCRGDRLMIVKNNYFYQMKDEKLEVRDERYDNQTNGENNGVQGDQISHFSPLISNFIANGDCVIVQRVRHVHEQYGFRFAEVTMTFPDYDDYELTAFVILDTLTSEAPSLTREQQQQLFEAVLEDYSWVVRKDERMKKLKTDKYYNALQVKFAYAVTCHKAQGGQWSHVYVDQGYMTDDMLNTDYIHWLYTAFTRATEKLFLVNWPKTQIEES